MKIINFLKWLINFFFPWKGFKKEEGAKFSNKYEMNKYIHSSYTWLLLNWINARLTEKASYQNVCLIAPIWSWKTSTYIIPNVLDKANQNVSMVINDPKGEVYKETSAYMKSKWFNIILYDPQNPERSNRIKILDEANNEIELNQIWDILIKCTKEVKGDIWGEWAVRFVSVFLKCLKNAGKENKDYFTLTNLYYLFQNFGKDWTQLQNWVVKYSIDPDNIEDESIIHEWNAVNTGNEEWVQSFILTALTALKALWHKNIAQLTSETDFNISEIRERKTVMYFCTPPQYASYYSFLISLFFRTVFNVCMRDLPNKDTLPVHILFDEFWNTHIPWFSDTANTLRAYKVSLSIILQWISQIDNKYGVDEAKTIQGAFLTKMTLCGADPETTKLFETLIWRKRITQLQQTEKATFSENYREEYLINASEIRTLKQKQLLIVSWNKDPIILNTLWYYENRVFKKCVEKWAYKIKPREIKKLVYLDLATGKR